MPKVSHGYTMGVASLDDGDALHLAIARLAERIRGHVTPVAESIGICSAYAREMLIGRKRMTLELFIAGLRKIERLGDREEKGRGREWVAAILNALAAPFGLRVVPATPAEERAVGEVEKEVREANTEVHRAFAEVDEVLADHRLTDAKFQRASARLSRAKSEIDDVAQALGQVRDRSAR